MQMDLTVRAGHFTKSYRRLVKCNRRDLRLGLDLPEPQESLVKAAIAPGKPPVREPHCRTRAPGYCHRSSFVAAGLV